MFGYAAKETAIVVNVLENITALFEEGCPQAAW